MIRATSRTLLIKARPFLVIKTKCACDAFKLTVVATDKSTIVGVLFDQSALRSKGIKHTVVSGYKMKIDLIKGEMK